MHSHSWNSHLQSLSFQWTPCQLSLFVRFPVSSFFAYSLHPMVEIITCFTNTRDFTTPLIFCTSPRQTSTLDEPHCLHFMLKIKLEASFSLSCANDHFRMITILAFSKSINPITFPSKFNHPWDSWFPPHREIMISSHRSHRNTSLCWLAHPHYQFN